MARKALGPATLEIIQAVRAQTGGGQAAGPMVAAVSGGADSLALAHAVAHVCAERDLPYAAVTVDHGLQDGSARRARDVVDQLSALGFTDVAVRTVDVTPASGSSAGPEADARSARYGVLEAEAAERGADLLLGHTLDDQAETVLLGLLRGSGPRSLAGMAVRSGPRLRPLLGIRRERTRTACAELGLDVWDDPHNADPRFTRSRIRQQVLPMLADQLGPGIPEALARTADLARSDADLLDSLANDLYPGVVSSSKDRDAARGEHPTLSCAPLARTDPALRTRVIKRWLTDCGAAEVPYVHVRAVEALIVDWHGQHQVQLRGIVVRRIAGELTIVGNSRL